MARAFEYLKAYQPLGPGGTPSVSPDLLYEILFLQYLRVKAALFGLLVHPPGERGLENFQGHFRQIKVYAPEPYILRQSDHAEPGLQIRATERRVSPDAWPERCERWEDEDAEWGPAKRARAEVAWLVHFQRRKPDSTLPFFGTVIRQMDSQANMIIRALASKPSRLQKLRGIDICGVEADQPLWVAAETLRRVRLRSSEIAGRQQRLGLQPLRLTLHVGEEFDWLTSGVRAVAEPFCWRLIERGDRLGHAIAITFNPLDWWDRKSGHHAEVKRLDRFLDLCFLAKYTEGARSGHEDRWLARQILTLLESMNFEQVDASKYDRRDLVAEAIKFWCALGGPTTRRMMTSRGINSFQSPHERWIYSLIWNRSIRDKAMSILLLTVSKDRFGRRGREYNLLVKARERLIVEIARWQICIETNPTSNLIVGGLDAMGAAQDFLHSRPTLQREEKEFTFPWTISTDDPITFSTSLADEYAYTWAGMVLRHKAPYDPSYARALLDEAAASSMRARFSLPVNED